MSKFQITGQKTLKGTVKISGAKNAALKILPASILADSPSTILNVPKIVDIDKMKQILESIGAEISTSDGVIQIDPRNVRSYQPDPKLIKKIRGSIVIVGPLLAKFGKAVFSQPGGCLIGARPIDDHLDVFSQMGVKVKKIGSTYHLKGKPKAGDIVLSKMSVTATENAMMAAVLSPGTTRIHVAAAEPEIADLAKYLNSMGAKIRGAGTHDICIEGVTKLSGASHKIIPDRVEAGTYLMAGASTNSEIKIGPVISNHLSIVLKKLKSAGAKFDIKIINGEEYIITRKHGDLKPENMDTRTYPGFPTDLQSPYAILMTQAKGETQIFETIFESRFLFVDEIQLMGAKTEILSPHVISIKGPTALEGTEIYSRDLRGGAALIIAGLLAKGTTIINGTEFIDRGYEDMDGKLLGIGAEIKRIRD